MNVLLVSQCSKRALTETRRILDQFAERRGERVGHHGFPGAAGAVEQQDLEGRGRRA